MDRIRSLLDESDNSLLYPAIRAIRPARRLKGLLSPESRGRFELGPGSAVSRLLPNDDRQRLLRSHARKRPPSESATGLVRLFSLKRDASEASRKPSIGIGINHIDFR